MDITNQQQAIHALLKVAKVCGIPDTENGRRRWTRYRVGTPLEITSDPKDAANAWHAITHHISGGGLGFWARQDFVPGQRIHVREYKVGASTTWLSAHVRFSVVGMNGYLVGVSFDHPIEPGETSGETKSAEPQARRGSAQTVERDRDLPRLRAYGGLGCLIGGAFALGTAVALAAIADFDAATLRQVLASGLVVLAGCAAASWRLLGREAERIAEIARGLENLASGEAKTEISANGTSREWAALHRAFLRLQNRSENAMPSPQTHNRGTTAPTGPGPQITGKEPRDLENLLTSIQVYAEMLEENLAGLAKSDQASLLEIISQESNRLTSLVDDLLETQRLQAGPCGWSMTPVQPASVVRAVAQAYQPIAERSGTAIAIDCPHEPPTIYAASDKLTQAVGNLVEHAVKVAGTGGIVRLVVEARDNEVRIRVSDSGPGIPRDSWDSVFDPFGHSASSATSPGQRWGLGPYVARKIAEGHGGRLWLNSEVGEGTEFIMALPVRPAASPAQPMKNANARLASVVVCDADAELAALMANELKKAHFEVRAAHSAARLLSHLAERTPDVVVTDLALPDMPGRDLLNVLGRNGTKEFALVVHSADGDCRDLRKHGVDLLLRRPAFAAELVEAARIAMIQHQESGLLALVVGDPGVNASRLREAMEAHGHVILTTRDMAGAVGVLSQYAVDVVVVPAGGENATQAALQTLKDEVPEGTRLVIPRSDLNERQCAQISTDHVFHVPCRRGQESALATALHNLWRETAHTHKTTAATSFS